MARYFSGLRPKFPRGLFNSMLMGIVNPPAIIYYLIDSDGNYLIDRDGNFIISRTVSGG